MQTFPPNSSLTKIFPQTKSRSSHQSCSMYKGVLRNFTKFTGKHLYESLFFKKVAGLRHRTLLKKRLWHRCFPVNFVKFLRTPLNDYFWKTFRRRSSEIAFIYAVSDAILVFRFIIPLIFFT